MLANQRPFVLHLFILPFAPRIWAPSSYKQKPARGGLEFHIYGWGRVMKTMVCFLLNVWKLAVPDQHKAVLLCCTKKGEKCVGCAIFIAGEFCAIERRKRVKDLFFQKSNPKVCCACVCEWGCVETSGLLAGRWEWWGRLPDTFITFERGKKEDPFPMAFFLFPRVSLNASGRSPSRLHR